MITLTDPAEINSVLGGNAPVAYDKVVLSPFKVDPVARTIIATVRATSTTAPTMQPISGAMTVNAATAKLTFEVSTLDVLPREISLTGPQVTAVQNIITNAQNALEAGLVSLGIVAGTQSTGT